MWLDVLEMPSGKIRYVPSSFFLLPSSFSLTSSRDMSRRSRDRWQSGGQTKKERENKTDKQDEYLSAGADGIIPKPVHQKSVLEQIKEARKRIAGKTVPKVIQPSY
jgi:hypothetical protein